MSATLRARSTVQTIDPLIERAETDRLKEQMTKSTSVNSASFMGDVAYGFHVVAFILYLRVWLWHFSPAAAVLPGASGFGWFFRYLTFYSFTLQLVQCFLCVGVAFAREPKLQQRVKAWADDLSCALFGLANAVTLLYYIIEAATNDIVEGGSVPRPPWLGFAVHVMNSLFAWGDLLLASPRSYSKRSLKVSMVIVTVYTVWIVVCREVSGSFPYPFLNKLPHPQGFLVVLSGGLLVFFIAFQIGKQLSRGCAAWK